MDINLMVLNLGNSRLASGVFVAGTLKHVSRTSHDRKADWPRVLAETWKHIAGRDQSAVAAAGVNPPLVKELEHVVTEVTGQTIQWVGKDLSLPIPVLTEQPEETGIDRIVNIAAAYEQLGKACIVVDAGTAITIDCCNDAGAFLGGAIAPGPNLMLRALHEHTAKLPLLELEAPNTPIGRNTRDAMLHGAYHGIRGMVKELAENYATELGAWPEIIATGGAATKLFEGWELIHAISPDLTLYGIALTYAEHQIKHKP